LPGSARCFSQNFPFTPKQPETLVKIASRPVAGRRERPVSGSLNAVDASHESAVDVVRRLGKLRLFLYWLAVRIACDIDASEIAPGIDKYVKLNAPTSIAKN
jgi:hypothetical protein